MIEGFLPILIFIIFSLLSAGEAILFFAVFGLKKSNPTLFRLLTTKLYAFIFNFFLRKKYTDATNGLRAFRYYIFNDMGINSWYNCLNIYESETYMLYQVVK